MIVYIVFFVNLESLNSCLTLRVKSVQLLPRDGVKGKLFKYKIVEGGNLTHLMWDDLI